VLPLHKPHRSNPSAQSYAASPRSASTPLQVHPHTRLSVGDHCHTPVSPGTAPVPVHLESSRWERGLYLRCPRQVSERQSSVSTDRLGTRAAHHRSIDG